jgi:gamma-glutamylcyclotransferase (GGCT)/AIG2-like uncharacterized protein YtfP
MDELLFVYGSLRDQQVQLDIIGRLVQGTPDAILGYNTATITIEDCVYPILVPAPDGMVEGEILRVSKDELDKIDVYESEDYQRVKVKLRSGTVAWVYRQPE